MGLYIIIGFVREGRLEVYKIVWTPIWCEPSLHKPYIYKPYTYNIPRII